MLDVSNNLLSDLKEMENFENLQALILNYNQYNGLNQEVTGSLRIGNRKSKNSENHKIGDET